MSKYDEWKDRKDGFDRHLAVVTGTKTLDEAEESDRGRPTDSNENLINLTLFLSDFTTRLFDFFLNGFSDFLGSNEPQKIKLIPSAEYPPEYVLQKILQQASFDLTVIQRAIEQRKDAVLSSYLEKCDQLALSALAIAFPKLADDSTWLIDPVKPFVYFQRETSVRIIPYANAVLIGVPYSALCQPIDLLSIAHEIGHHVYETGRFSKTDPINLYFEKYFADQPDWIQNWLEEIFADLYGFLVAGPIIAFSLQEILLDNLPGSLLEDDGDHPAGIVRPLIYGKLFNSDEYKAIPGAQNTAVALRDKWLNEGRKRGFANRFKSVTDSNFIEGTLGSNTLSLVMQNMNKEINAKTNRAFVFPARPDQNDNLQPWTPFPDGSSSTSTNGHFDFNAPFAGLNEKNLISSPSGQVQVEKMTNLFKLSKFKLSRKDQNAYWLTKQIGYWDNWENWDDRNNALPLPALPPDIWKLIFTAFSWADKPADDTRPGHGPEKLNRESIRW